MISSPHDVGFCFLILVPPLEVASHSLRCSYFLGPIGLGHFRMRCTNPQRCALVAGHDIFGVGGRWMLLPPSASNKLVPPPLEVLPSAFPPSLDALSVVGDCAPGARIPALSVRSALGMHDVSNGGVLGGYVEGQCLRGWRSLFIGVGWWAAWGRWSGWVGGFWLLVGGGKGRRCPMKPTNPLIFDCWFAAAMATMVADGLARLDWSSMGRCPGARLILI